LMLLSFFSFSVRHDARPRCRLVDAAAFAAALPLAIWMRDAADFLLMRRCFMLVAYAYGCRVKAAFDMLMAEAMPRDATI